MAPHARLFVLAFDHRRSFEKMVGRDLETRIAAKSLVWRGFLEALTQGARREEAGLLIDEQYGSTIAREARQRGVVFAMPVEKTEARDAREKVSPIEHSNTCFLGTSVESGSAMAAIVATGPQTYFGKMAKTLGGPLIETAFDRGVRRFTWLMIRFMVVMVPLVFLINGLTKHDWHEAFFFSLAVAVGLTPEMLPMIVSVCLSKGALAMSRKKVIVKRLNSIQNFGAMNVLCTDKTGTLTIDKVILEIYCDVFKNENKEVLRDAYRGIRSRLQACRPLLEQVAKTLQDKQEVSGKELRELVKDTGPEP